MKDKDQLKNNKVLQTIITTLTWFLKSFSIGIGMLFLYNLIGSNFNLNVPFNIWTILIVSVFKLPGLVSIIIFLMLV